MSETSLFGLIYIRLLRETKNLSDDLTCTLQSSRKKPHFLLKETLFNAVMHRLSTKIIIIIIIANIFLHSFHIVDHFSFCLQQVRERVYHANSPPQRTKDAIRP